MSHNYLRDVADRSVYEWARERDRVLWVSDAVREWRDAIRAGIDDAPFLTTVILRKNACDRARAADRAGRSGSVGHDGR